MIAYTIGRSHPGIPSTSWLNADDPSVSVDGVKSAAEVSHSAALRDVNDSMSVYTTGSLSTVFSSGSDTKSLKVRSCILSLNDAGRCEISCAARTVSASSAGPGCVAELSTPVGDSARDSFRRDSRESRLPLHETEKGPRMDEFRSSRSESSE